MHLKSWTPLLCSLLLLTSPCVSEEPAQQEEAREVPTDFVRDVMQPLGMPVVSFYHAIRESLFLNVRLSKAGPLEVLGDFFLIPSRYLFAGKTLHLQKTEEGYRYTLSQNYRYHRLHALKSLGAAASLPVSYPMGSLCKGLSYLSPKVRRLHREIKRNLKIAQEQSHLEEYKTRGLPPFHSEEEIPCLHYARPSSLTKKQKIEIQALKEITRLLDAHHILYWIDCGTCLGAYRYGGIIPWDWDIDLSILVEDHDNVKRILSSLDPRKYQIQDWSSYSKPKTFLKLYVKETKNFIDIYHYQINQPEQTISYLYTYIDSPFPQSWKRSELKCTKPLTYEQIFPLKKAHFDSLTVWAPGDVVSFLQSKYGLNLEPTMVWNEGTQEYNKVEGHPYYQ